jgi:small-conductance mechanosensitive channel
MGQPITAWDVCKVGRYVDIRVGVRKKHKEVGFNRALEKLIKFKLKTMKVKLVKENLTEAMSFEKNKDPRKSLDIGKDSTYSHEQVLQKLSEMGVKIHIDFDPENRSKVLENIYEIEKYVKEFIDLGVKPGDIEISYPDSVCIKGFTVKDSNNVLLHCLTEEDANIVMDTIEKFMINGTLIEIDRSSMTPYIHFHKKNNWLKDLKENRKKYMTLK